MACLANRTTKGKKKKTVNAEMLSKKRVERNSAKNDDGNDSENYEKNNDGEDNDVENQSWQ
jgi:hypothetical protein